MIILDNSITGMTGHQQNPTTGYNIKGDPAGKIDLESLCRAMGISRVRVVDPYDLAACDQCAEGGAGRAGAVCHHQSPALRAAQVCEDEAAAGGRSGQVRRLQVPA